MLVSTHYMDEAERCHRIVYIAYGAIVAAARRRRSSRNPGLETFVLSGRQAGEAARALDGARGVEQVAAFGQEIHVVGSDRAALEASVKDVAARFAVTVEPGETTLEDVFIRLMSEAQRRGAANERFRRLARIRAILVKEVIQMRRDRLTGTG